MCSSKFLGKRLTCLLSIPADQYAPPSHVTDRKSQRNVTQQQCAAVAGRQVQCVNLLLKIWSAGTVLISQCVRHRTTKSWQVRQACDPPERCASDRVVASSSAYLTFLRE